MEVYIDDVVVKLNELLNHVTDHWKAFERMMTHKLKMNPQKYAFGVSAKSFLGFLVNQRGIGVDKIKA